jgi:hypothetical protein
MLKEKITIDTGIIRKLKLGLYIGQLVIIWLSFK